MNESRGLRPGRDRAGERGGTRLKFLIVLVLIAVVAYAGYQFIPVAYQANVYKSEVMQPAVDKAAIMGQSTGWVKDQLRASGKDYGVPPDAAITVEQTNGRMQARVQFTRPISFPGYTYQYSFDHTARSTELFSSAK